MGRILAIDFGKKRTGIAVTDPLKIIANKLTTVNSNEIFTFLDDYFSKEDVECVVIGYPVTLNNQQLNHYDISILIKIFKKVSIHNLIQVDERYTSKLHFRQ